MKVKIDDIGQIITGTTPSKTFDDYYRSKDILFAKPDVFTKDTVSKLYSTNDYISESARVKARIVPSNAVLITCIGNIGKVLITTKETAFNQQINAIIPNENFDVNYVALLILANRKKLESIAHAAVMPLINKTQFSNFIVNVHGDLNMQKSITNKIDKISAVINKKQQQISSLDNLIKSRFVEMFGSIHDNTLYTYKPIYTLCDVISGGTPSRENIMFWDEGKIPWIKTTELQNELITSVEEKITKLGLDKSSAKLVPKHTILIAMYGQGKTRGMTGYLGLEACTNQACACILPSSKINSIFLWKYLALSYYKLRDMAKGGNQPNLNINMIKSFLVLVPPNDLQNKFVEFVQQVDKSKFDLLAYKKNNSIKYITV